MGGTFVAALVVAWPKVSAARLAGVESNGGCANCHGIGNGAAPTVSVVADSANVMAGQKVTLTITIGSATALAGGFYIPRPNAGFFTALAGTRVWPDGGISHSAPGRASGNQVTFQVAWTAPTTPAVGGVDFPVFVLSANGDNSNRNDVPGDGFLSVAYGCGAGTKYYVDMDSDGYGSMSQGWTMNYTQPAFFAAQVGDCNEGDAKIHPGAVEICDGKDNNCDGVVDENLANVVLCEDKDGDGHGVVGGAVHTGCTPNLKGFGVCDGDCNDNDPTVHPGAAEACNDQDDNCDGKIDENARPTCGKGWCKRYGEGCGPNLCQPGAPRAEMCNQFDDDCDGVDDNGTDVELCGEGAGCRSGRCVPIDVDPDAGGGSAATTGGGAGPGTTTTTGSSGATGGGGGTAPNPPSSSAASCSVGRRTCDAGWGLFVALSALGAIVARRARPCPDRSRSL